MTLSTALKVINANPQGYSFNFDERQQLWVARFENPAFRTTVEGKSLNACIETLYQYVTTRENNGLITTLPR